MNNKILLEKIYEYPERVPWKDNKIPKELIDISRILKPNSKVLEIGCGLGFHSIYLAKKGFDVTAIDISEKAIEYSNSLAKEKDAKINFRALNCLDINLLEEKYDFILEWGVLHFISFEKRKEYVGKVSRMLNKKGIYVTLSFNIDSPEWGAGKVRKGITKSKIYYSSTEELINLYEEHFNIIELKKRNTYFSNSKNTHIHNYFLMRKK